jgi:putative oxidoreductase
MRMNMEHSEGGTGAVPAGAALQQAWYTAMGLLILRVGAGTLMLTLHGWGKLINFREQAATWADPIGLGPHLSLTLATFAEFFCALLLVLGLFTRLAAIPLIVTILVAGVIVHAADPWDAKEKAFLFLTMYLAVAFAGPGRYSLDGLINRGCRGLLGWITMP